MENPCFVMDTDWSGGELRRWRSVPGAKACPPTVATIYRPEDYRTSDGGPGAAKEGTDSEAAPGGGWRLQFVPQAKPQATLVSALLLATVITLAATGSLVYLLKAVHTGYAPTTVGPDTWTGDMVVTGEFTVTNEEYSLQLSDITSNEFQTLASSIGHQLELLFSESLMSELFKGAAVISFGHRTMPTPNPWRRVAPSSAASSALVVHCWLLLRATDPLTIRKVGLAFLGGLGHRHNRLWLGSFTVDVQSISFQASPEEVTWSQWSGWSECSLGQSSSNNSTYERKRTRFCIRLASASPAHSQEPCSALPSRQQDVNDEEVKPCDRRREREDRETTSTLAEATSREVTQPTTDLQQESSIPPSLEAITSLPLAATTSPPPTPVMYITTHQAGDWDKRPCSECVTDEVCVALEGESSPPTCRTPLDTNDPTGCGGHCKINTELCHRMGNNAYRCVDDSKCLADEWQCGNKLCIPLVKRCDGHFNCYDHTDEYDCECDLKLNFHCGKNSSCLPKNKKCDGIVDCWDALDEINCTVACLGSAQFTCNDSQCIPSKQFCDGYADCKDKSDEPFGCGGVCKNHEWRCSNGRCIMRRDVCNNVADCGDESDEINCAKKKNLF